jgi:Glucodextranase, domain B/Bacterial Ig-like domain (group 2)
MNATVTFTCTAGTYPIASCPSPQTVSSEGLGRIVSGTVTDTAGDTATASVTINLDKTIPALTVSSPAEQTVESSFTVTVSGTLTDALSGVSGVTCDGVTATLSGGGFSCNISLAVGVNLVVVRGTDIAGNVAGDYFHLSLTGTLLAPASLAVTPTGVNMVVGGTRQFTVVDDQGRPRSDATWSVDNTSIATIDTNSSPTLTAVATGTAALTATLGSVTAQTQVNILSGTSLPVGTVLWSVPTSSGSQVNHVLQAVPALGIRSCR